MNRDDLAGRIFDLLVENPNGLTIEDLSMRISMPRDACRRGIHDARLTLGEDDTLFILAEPQGPREPWLYKLVDGRVLVDATESQWIHNRIGDAETRIHTMNVGMAVAERATDGRTIEGKKARLLHKALSRLDEDLRDLGGGEDD